MICQCRTDPATLVKQFDPVKYNPIQFTNNGLFWDVYSRIAAWTKKHSI